MQTIRYLMDAFTGLCQGVSDFTKSPTSMTSIRRDRSLQSYGISNLKKKQLLPASSKSFIKYEIVKLELREQCLQRINQQKNHLQIQEATTSGHQCQDPGQTLRQTHRHQSLRKTRLRNDGKIELGVGTIGARQSHGKSAIYTKVKRALRDKDLLTENKGVGGLVRKKRKRKGKRFHASKKSRTTLWE